MAFDIRVFLPSDYDAVLDLWRSAAGVTLRDVDEREPLTSYLSQHAGLSFVAVANDHIVGAVLCGTDGRRGYLQHLAVAPDFRRRGIGRALAERCVVALRERGIDKCHLMVNSNNRDGQLFWARLGWVDRGDIKLMSHTASGSATA